MRLILLLCLSLSTLAACEQSYIIDGRVTVASTVAPAAPGNLTVIVDGRETETSWTILDASSGSHVPQAYAPGTPGYPYRYEEFGKSPHAIYVAAFVDLDRNGMLDPGEPYGEFEGNPIIDARWGSTASPTVADLVIDRLSP